MSSAVPLRTDFNAATVRNVAQRCKDAGQSRRLLSIAAVYDGMNRADAAKIGGRPLPPACRTQSRTAPSAAATQKKRSFSMSHSAASDTRA